MVTYFNEGDKMNKTDNYTIKNCFVCGKEIKVYEDGRNSSYDTELTRYVSDGTDKKAFVWNKILQNYHCNCDNCHSRGVKK